jgi:hypothetical protein
MRWTPGRPRGSSISTDSVSGILADTRATRDRKCAIREWNGGTNIGRGAIENTARAPYAQLASALTAQGDRDAANEIRYLGRVRERETQTGWSYIWSSALQWVAGFGIGNYTFLGSGPING